MKKRILSALLVLCMVFSLGTVGAMAEDETTTPTEEPTEEAEVLGETLAGTKVTEDSETNYEAYIIYDGTERLYFDTLKAAVQYVNTKNNNTSIVNNYIILTKEVKVNLTEVTNSNDGAIQITESMTIDGYGNLITATGSKDKAHVINILGNNSKEITVNLCNLTVRGEDLAQHGINVYANAEADITVNLDNVYTNNNKGYGLCIGGATVNATNLHATGNDWGGVNVDTKNGVSSSFTLDGSETDLTGNGASEESAAENQVPNASVVIESDEGVSTTTTLKEGDYDAVYTHNAEGDSAGEDTLVITGGNYGAVAVYGDETEDSVNISNAVVGKVAKVNKNANFIVNNSSVTSVVETLVGDSTSVDVDESGIGFTGGSTVGDQPTDNVVATIDGKPYSSLPAAINAAKAATAPVIIELQKDVTEPISNTNFTLTRDITIKGNYSVTFVPDYSKEAALIINGCALTLDGVKITVSGSTDPNGRNGVAFSMKGNEPKLELKNGAELSVETLDKGFVMPNEDASVVVGADSTLTIDGIDGNATNGGSWTVNGGTLNVKNCGNYGLSVNEFKTTGSANVTISDVAYGAIYAHTTIDIDGVGTEVTIENCGSGLPFSSDYGHCYAPVQIRCEKVGEEVPNNAAIKINEGATVTITGDEGIYVVADTGFESKGKLKAVVEKQTETNPTEVLVTFTDSDGTILHSYITKKTNSFTVPAMEEELEGLKCWKVGDVEVGLGTNYPLTVDVTFVAVYEEASYNVSVSVSGGNGTAVASATTATQGQQVTLTLNPSSGYEVGNISANVTLSGTGNVRTFTMPSTDVSIVVTFKPVSTTDPDEPVGAPVLTALSAYGGRLSPSFDPDITNYTVSLDYWTDSVRLGSAAPAGMTISTSGNITNSGYVYVDEGDSEVITYTVYANGVTKTYTVRVYRADSPVAYLTDLYYSDGELEPRFSRYTTSYTLTLPSTVESVTLDATGVSNSDVSASGYDERDSGEYIVEVDPGKSQTVRFTVTKSGETVTYSITVVRKAADRVTIEDTLHGEVTVSDVDAKEGDRVYIYLDPDYGYELDELVVTDDDGRNITVTKVDDETYRFVMPEENVVVEATFKLILKTMPFVDVSTGAWYYDSVLYAYTNGLMDGISDTQFNPNGTMTRAMIWAVLGRIDGKTITGANWSSTARSWAMSEGVSDGTDANGNITREQLVTMLWRYVGEPYAYSGLNNWADRYSVSSYAKTAMAWAVNEGIITGATSTTLNPKGYATRAECATMLMRFVESIG